jgi:hypothetical protein
VADGKIVFNTPGQTNRHDGMTCIGCATPRRPVELAPACSNPTLVRDQPRQCDTNTPNSSTDNDGRTLGGRSFEKGYNAECRASRAIRPDQTGATS